MFGRFLDKHLGCITLYQCVCFYRICIQKQNCCNTRKHNLKPTSLNIYQFTYLQQCFEFTLHQMLVLLDFKFLLGYSMYNDISFCFNLNFPDYKKILPLSLHSFAFHVLFCFVQLIAYSSPLAIFYWVIFVYIIESKSCMHILNIIFCCLYCKSSPLLSCNCHQIQYL